MPLIEVKSKKTRKSAQNKNTQNWHSFFAIAFFRGLCLSQHQRILDQHKILRFLVTHIDIFKKMFWVIISLFEYFKCKCEKTVHFKTFCKK
jgi:hypothetical protein